jgi:hypothetical protein
MVLHRKGPGHFNQDLFGCIAIAAAKCERGEKGNTKASNGGYSFIFHDVPFLESILFLLVEWTCFSRYHGLMVIPLLYQIHAFKYEKSTTHNPGLDKLA